MTPVSDPALLQQLEGPQAAPGLRPVSDPALLAQLEGSGDDNQAALRAKARKEIEAAGGPGLPSLANRIPVLGPFLDEASAAIQGGVRSLTGMGRTYDEALAFNREREAMAAKESPVYDAVGGTVAGLTMAGGPLAKLFTARTMPGMMAQGAAYGGAIGGVDSFGNAEGDVDRRMDAAGGGAVSSAAIGAVAPPLIQAAGAGLGRVSDAVSPTLARWGAAIPERFGLPKMSAGTAPPPSPGADAAAEKVIANQLARAGVTPEQLAQRLDDASAASLFGPNSRAANAVAPVDLDPSLQRLAGSVARQQPEAGNIARSFIVARQTGQPRDALSATAGLETRPLMSRAGERPAGQFERVSDALKHALQIADDKSHGFAGTAYKTDQAIVQRARAEAKPAYDAVYKAGENVDLRPVINPVLQKWQAQLIDEPVVVAKRLERWMGQFSRAVTDAGNKTHIERLDKVKQVLDGEIDKLFTSNAKMNPAIGRTLTAFKNDVLEALDGIKAGDLGAKYVQARSNYSSHMEMREALDLGRQAWKQDSEIGIEQYRAMTDGQKKLFRLGLWDGFKKEGARAKRTDDIVQKFENPRIQEILEEAIPKSRRADAEFARRAERFGQWLENEKRMIGTRNEVLGGSQTAERVGDDKALNAMMSLVEEVKGQPSLFAMGVKTVETALNKLFGFRADTAASVSRMLFTADPYQRQRLIRAVQARMTPGRAEMLARYLGEYRQLVTQSAAASLNE